MQFLLVGGPMEKDPNILCMQSTVKAGSLLLGLHIVPAVCNPVANVFDRLIEQNVK